MSEKCGDPDDDVLDDTIIPLQGTKVKVYPAVVKNLKCATPTILDELEAEDPADAD